MPRPDEHPDPGMVKQLIHGVVGARDAGGVETAPGGDGSPVVQPPLELQLGDHEDRDCAAKKKWGGM